MDYLKNRGFDMVLQILVYTWKDKKKLVWTEDKVLVEKQDLLFCRYLPIHTKNSHRRCSAKKGVLKNFANVFANGLQACNFIKKRLQQRYFTMKFVKFLRAPILMK